MEQSKGRRTQSSKGLNRKGRSGDQTSIRDGWVARLFGTLGDTSGSPILDCGPGQVLLGPRVAKSNVDEMLSTITSEGDI